MLLFFYQHNGNLNGLKHGSQIQLGIYGERNRILLVITKHITAEKNMQESEAAIIQHDWP